MEVLTNVYLQYSEVKYLIMSLLLGHRRMGHGPHVLINRPIKIDLGNNGDDLPEMLNARWSRHLKVRASVGDVNNKDYTFNCTWEQYL